MVNLTPDAKLQKANYQQALAVQQSHEARTKKLGVTEQYIEEMRKYQENGTVTRITPQELQGYDGGKHFIAHFPVIKMSSTSTKVRIVSDSAMKNAITGKSFNDLVADGGRPTPPPPGYGKDE